MMLTGIGIGLCCRMGVVVGYGGMRFCVDAAGWLADGVAVQHSPAARADTHTLPDVCSSARRTRFGILPAALLWSSERETG